MHDLCLFLVGGLLVFGVVVAMCLLGVTSFLVFCSMFTLVLFVLACFLLGDC